MADQPDPIKAIFMAALEKTTLADRAAYLDEACASDAALRHRVEALFQAHDRTDRLLDQPAMQHIEGQTADKQPGDGVALDFLSPSAKPGALGRLGHYEVLEVVGKGGMGIVLRAFDEKLHRVVAIKVLAPECARDNSARQRFVREAQATAAVTHDNVIAIHGVESDGPIPYLIMQFIEGSTLQQKLDRTGPLPVKEVLRLGIQIADGLAAAHRHGLVHRDVKPANILLENCIERVKITDFGLARAVDDASVTQSGFIAGTPEYMSPEQANGEKVDSRSDLFSFGSVLYSLCAGHSPFHGGTTLAVLKRLSEETPRPLREINPDVPEWLEATIACLHSRDPAARFATAREVADLLSRGLTQVQAGDGPSTTLRKIVPHRRAWRGRWVAAIAAMLAVIGVGVAGWLIYQAWIGGGQGATTGGPERAAPARPVVLQPSRQLPRMHSAGLRAVAFSPDGKVLATGGMDKNIFLWDTQTWQARGPLEGHNGEVLALDFSPKDGRLASITTAADSCLVRLWNVETAELDKPLGPAGLSMWCVKFSPDGKTVACGGRGRKLWLLDVETGNGRVIDDVDPGLLRTVSFSFPDGRLIATGGRSRARLWDTTTRDEVPTEVPLPPGYPVFLPGGRGLAVWHYGESPITLIDLPSGRERKTWRAHPETMAWLAVSPDGRFLASVGKEGVARIWSTEDFRAVATLNGHSGMIYGVAFSPDGKQLATGGRDDLDVLIWDLPAVCHVRK